MKNFLILIILAWIVFSIGYIGYDQWQRFRFKQFQAGYQGGVADSVKVLMEESGKCVPITLAENDKEIKMIAIDCLQGAPSKQAQPEPQPQPEAQPEPQGPEQNSEQPQE